MRKEMLPSTQKVPQMISAPLTSRRVDLSPELKNIVDKFHSQSEVSTDSAGHYCLAARNEKTGTTGLFNNETHGSRNYGRIDIDSRNSYVRTCLSPPSNLRPEVPPGQGMTISSACPRHPRPYSTFSAKTQIVKDRRPILRRVLDAGGCTKGEKFDIRDFAPVQIASRSVVTASLPAELKEIQPRALREEGWRENVRQTLYPLTPSRRRRPLSGATNTCDRDAW